MTVSRRRDIEAFGVEVHRPDFKGIEIVVYQQDFRAGHVAQTNYHGSEISYGRA